MTDALAALTEALAEARRNGDAPFHYQFRPGGVWMDAPPKMLSAAILAHPAMADLARKAEAAERAYDLLAGMWSWHDESMLSDVPGSLHPGWVKMAGRVLHDAVGRPSSSDAAMEGDRD